VTAGTVPARRDERSDDRSDELEALRATVAAVCRDAGGTAVVRDLDPDGPGYAAGVWRVLADEVGVAGLGLPEEAGGLGGLAELAVVGECLGAALMPVPFLSGTVLSGQLLARCGDAGRPLLERVAAGDVVATALIDDDGAWNPAALPLRATHGDAGWTATGRASYVLDGVAAAALVLVAAGPDGPVVLAVDPAAAGVEARRLATLDLSRAQAQVTLADTPAVPLATGAGVPELVGAAVDVALVVQAAELLGGAQAAFDLTLGYVRTRRQFGRVIGGFQAVKHRCADMLLDVELARSAVGRAVDAADDPAALAEAASVAKAWCADAFTRVSAAAVHLHGGIGFTWEHDAHLYFRRARADAALLGDADHHRERLARLLGW
jgi:alkylation response protein AidB-like acyl-CoA dehydrogenase